MIDLFLAIFIASLAVYYLTDIFVLVDSESDSGPFESDTKQFVWVRFTPDGQIDRDTRKVHLWDWVRRVFGLYEVIKTVKYEDDEHTTDEVEEVWYVLPKRAPVWECPHCLGFWMSIVPSIMVAATVGYPITFMLWMLPISGLHSLFVSAIDAMYSKDAGGRIIALSDEDDYDSDSA